MALSATDPQPSITIHRPDPYPAKSLRSWNKSVVLTWRTQSIQGLRGREGTGTEDFLEATCRV